MKKAFVLFLLFVLFSSFCFQKYLIKIEDQEHYVAIMVKTSENRNSICRLIIDKLKIITPSINEEGYLIMDLITDPNSVCLMAIGPHKGRFLFEKERQLPYGEYHLIIYNEDYGLLNVSKNKSCLVKKSV